MKKQHTEPGQFTSTEFSVPLNSLRAMASLASKDGTRYVLCGVMVEARKDKLLLVATDGRKMGVLNIGPCDDAFVESPTTFIIPRVMIENAAKVFSRSGIVRVLLGKDGVLCIESPDFKLSSKPIDGNYPKWRNIVPRAKRLDGMNLNVNFDYLSEFRTACVLLSKGKKDKPTVYVRGYASPADGSHSPYTIHFARIPFLGILMPIDTRSIQMGEDDIPNWIDLA